MSRFSQASPGRSLDDGVGFTPVPSLDLYRDPDPFRVPHPTRVLGSADLHEFGVMCGAGFPEPLTFSLRARASSRSAGAGT